MNLSNVSLQSKLVPHFGTLQQPYAVPNPSVSQAATTSDQVTLGSLGPAPEATSPPMPPQHGWRHALSVGFLAAASLCGAAAGYVAGNHAAAQPPASTSVSAPQPAQAASPASVQVPSTAAAHPATAAQQKAQITQAATAAVTQAVSQAAGQLAQSNPDRSINIQVRDINVVVVGFDDFIDATQNHAPASPAEPSTPGQPTQPSAPAEDGGKEQIRRTIEIHQGKTVIKASESIKPAPPAAPAAPESTEAKTSNAS